MVDAKVTGDNVILALMLLDDVWCAPDSAAADREAAKVQLERIVDWLEGEGYVEPPQAESEPEPDTLEEC